MQLAFVDDTVRQLCTTEELLVRAFGDVWKSVKLCLAVMSAAETLADVAAFAALTVRRVWQTVEGLIEFDVSHAAVLLRVRAPEGVLGDVTNNDREALALVRAVSVVDVYRVAAVVGA